MLRITTAATTILLILSFRSSATAQRPELSDEARVVAAALADLGTRSGVDGPVVVAAADIAAPELAEIAAAAGGSVENRQAVLRCGLPICRLQGAAMFVDFRAVELTSDTTAVVMVDRWSDDGSPRGAAFALIRLHLARRDGGVWIVQRREMLVVT